VKCYSCLKTIKSQYPYCKSCQKTLFDGKKIKPLDFDKTEFYEIKRKMTNRISLSGVQDKISLGYGNNNDLIPVSTNGKFILKPIPKNHESAINLDDIAANEHLSMQISLQVFKIPTALNALIEFKDGELAYITKRFDYSVKYNKKLDQEDFASILSYTEDFNGRNYKYESSYEECAYSIKKFVAAYIPALEDFYKRIILNYLIGNGDAHLKNFSLIRDYGRSDYSLSPNYDLLFTRFHLKEESDIAGLSLFQEYETEAFGAMGYYTLQDFEEFAKLIGIPDKRVIKIFEFILSQTNKVYELIDRSFLSDNAKEAYKNNYDNRLRNCLCYSIKSFPFVGITQKTIDKHLGMPK